MEALPPQFEISPNTVSTYVQCPQKFHYRYIKLLQPKVKTSARHFDKGNYFHELAHVLYSYIKSGVEPGSQTLQALIADRIRNDISKNTNANLLPVYAEISKKMTRYIQEQSPKIDEGMSVVAVEAELEFPVEDFNVLLFGYADLLYRKQGVFRVRDHKTGEKAWTQGDAKFSNQLLFYAMLVYKTYDEIPYGEISFVNTHEYKTARPFEDVFFYTKVLYTETELQIYFDRICSLAEKMVHSVPIPQYSQLCHTCPYQAPCYLERKGIDPTTAIEQHYSVVPRKKRHESFTQDNSKGDTSN